MAGKHNTFSQMKSLKWEIITPWPEGQWKLYCLKDTLFRLRAALSRLRDAVDRRSRRPEGGIMQPEGGILWPEGSIISNWPEGKGVIITL